MIRFFEVSKIEVHENFISSVFLCEKFVTAERFLVIAKLILDMVSKQKTFSSRKKMILFKLVISMILKIDKLELDD